jgi:MoaA/NifB/PqqE/SkfB family radical SAM enzyme
MSRDAILRDATRGELSTEDYRRLFEAEKAKGRKSVFLIGGEPTLRMDVVQLAYAYFGRNLALITNGVIPIPRSMKFAFAVSVDGGKSVHDAVRGRQVWNQVFANYADDHRVVLSCCLRKGTTDQIQQVIDDWVDTEVFGVSFFFMTPPKGNLSMSVQGEEREAARRELHRVVEQYPHFVRMNHTIVDLLCEEHQDECPVFRTSRWYDFQGRVVHHCLLGENADCAWCGCITPLYIRMIPQWWRFLDRRVIDFLTLPRDVRPCRRRGER